MFKQKEDDMRTITHKIYDYKDVMDNIDNIGDRVLNTHRDTLVNNIDWSDVVIHKKEERMEKLGYYDLEFNHTNCFGVQGEGVCITGRLELDKEVLNRLGIEENFIIAHLLSQQIEVSIIREGVEYNYSSIVVNSSTKFIGNTEIDNWLEEKALEIRNAVGEEIVNLSKALLKSLSDYYDYLRSDKALIEYFKDNDMEFYENGETL